MRALRLNIEDTVFDKVIYFLKNLPKEDITIIEESTEKNYLADAIETKSFSEHTANLIEEWKDDAEDDTWK